MNIQFKKKKISSKWNKQTNKSVERKHYKWYIKLAFYFDKTNKIYKSDKGSLTKEKWKQTNTYILEYKTDIFSDMGKNLILFYLKYLITFEKIKSIPG